MQIFAPLFASVDTPNVTKYVFFKVYLFHRWFECFERCSDVCCGGLAHQHGLVSHNWFHVTKWTVSPLERPRESLNCIWLWWHSMCWLWRLSSFTDQMAGRRILRLFLLSSSARHSLMLEFMCCYCLAACCCFSLLLWSSKHGVYYQPWIAVCLLV